MKTRSTAILSAAAALTLVAGPAAAHVVPGMAGLAHGLAHPFLGADHLLAMLAVGLLGGLRGGRLAWGLPFAFAGSLFLGALAGLHAPASHLLELAVAGSVLLIGLAVLLPRAVPAVPALAAAAAFGVLHGLAHGTEAPATGVLSFLVGMAATTLALHGIGVLAVRQAALRPLARLAGAGTAAAGLALLLST
jgi:urease accessory protein